MKILNTKPVKVKKTEPQAVEENKIFLFDEVKIESNNNYFSSDWSEYNKKKSEGVIKNNLEEAEKNDEMTFSSVKEDISKAFNKNSSDMCDFDSADLEEEKSFFTKNASKYDYLVKKTNPIKMEEPLKFIKYLRDLTNDQKVELSKRIVGITDYNSIKKEQSVYINELNKLYFEKQVKPSYTVKEAIINLEDYKMKSSFSSKPLSTKKIPEFYKKIENVTVGSDFELFLFDNNLKEVINAKPFVKGSKHFPFNFDTSSEFWCTSLDNILAEMNIPPVKNEKDFNSYVQKAIDYLESTLPKNITTLAQPAMYIKEEYLNTEESRQFGCTPSYDAYTLNENQQPDGGQTNLRTGAFHIHIKYDKMNFELSAELIKMLDLYLGVPSLLIEPTNDRRKLYGTPGEFRYSEDKTTEYRVLSNFFSKNESLRTWVFKNTMAAIEHMNTKGPLPGDTTNQIRKTIKNSLIASAEKFVDNYNIVLP